MGKSYEHTKKFLLKLGIQEVYDDITRIIKDKTKFNITESESLDKSGIRW